MTELPTQTVNYADALNQAVADQSRMCFANAILRYELAGDINELFTSLAAGICPTWNLVAFTITRQGLGKLYSDLERFHPRELNGLLHYLIKSKGSEKNPDQHLLALGIQLLIGRPILTFKNALSQGIGHLYGHSMSLEDGPDAPSEEFSYYLKDLRNDD